MPDDDNSKVHQVTVTKKEEIVRHGKHVRKDPWTRETGREWKKNQ